MKEPNLFTELGNYLKEKRELCKLSQAQVSKFLGYSSAQFISNFERGLCAPPMPKLKELIQLYKIQAREVMNLLMQEQKKYIEFHLLGSPSKKKKKSRKAV